MLHIRAVWKIAGTHSPLAAASTLHFCLAILWRIEAFSLKCPGKRAAINLVEKKPQHLISSIGYTLSLSLEKHLNAEIYAGNILFFCCKTNVVYFHHWGGPGCGSWAGRCCSSSVSCAKRHSCLPFVTWVWPKDQNKQSLLSFYIP